MNPCIEGFTGVAPRLRLILKRVFWWPMALTVGLAFFLVGLTGTAQAAAVVNPALPLAGISQQTLAEQWWQWIWRTPEVNNPALDPDGAWAGVNNNGPVFFLAGNFGGDSTRNITLQTGRPIFFPVLSTVIFETPVPPFICVGPGLPDPVGCLLAEISPEMDGATGLFATLDGQNLLQAHPSYRQTSTALFDLFFPAGNIYGLDPGYIPPAAVADGYWVGLDGLAPGAYVLKFGGTSGAGFNLAVTVNLTVPEPGALPLAALALLAAWAASLRARSQVLL